MQITAVVNQKGGVGKTATAVNVGGALAVAGRRVLLVDLDPQGDLTEALKIPSAESPATLADALTDRWTGDPAALVTVYDQGGAGRLAVMPNSLEMFTVGRELDRLRAREQRLARLLRPLDGMFDHVVIDCSPALDILCDNALTAADGVLIPAQHEDSSLRALELLLNQVSAVERELRETPLVLHGLVLSMLERGPGGKAKSNLARSVIEELEKLALPILAEVPRGVPITEAWRYGRLVVEYAPESEHAEAYRTLAKVLDGDR
jgi:chromosome partitioning protein